MLEKRREVLRPGFPHFKEIQVRVARQLLSILTVLSMFLLTDAAPAARADVIDNFMSETAFILYDSCHGEEIYVETEFHGIVRQIAKRDGSVTFDFQVNAHGSAVGLTSGTQYVFNDTYHTQDTYVGVTSSGTILQRSRLASPGSAENVTILFRFAYRFDGTDFIVDLQSVETVCHG
jgi:hypothetical protein